jgi:hypothetical protein
MTKAKDRTKVTPELQERVRKLRRKARNFIAKTEVVQFRLDEDTYRDLFSLSKLQRRAIGTLVREWITAKVKQETEANKSSSSRETMLNTRGIKATELAQELKSLGQPVVFLLTESDVDQATAAQVVFLQKQIDELRQRLAK